MEMSLIDIKSFPRQIILSSWKPSWAKSKCWLAWDCCSGENDDKDWDQAEGESVGEPVLLVRDPQVSLQANVDWWFLWADRVPYLGAAIFLVCGATAEHTHRGLLSLGTVEAWQDNQLEWEPRRKSATWVPPAQRVHVASAVGRPEEDCSNKKISVQSKQLSRSRPLRDTQWQTVTHGDTQWHTETRSDTFMYHHGTLLVTTTNYRLPTNQPTTTKQAEVYIPQPLPLVWWV